MKIVLTQKELVETLETLHLSDYVRKNLFKERDEEVVRKLIFNKETRYNTDEDLIKFDKVHYEDFTNVYVVTVTAVRSDNGFFKKWKSETKLLYIEEIA